MKKRNFYPDRTIGVWIDYKHAFLVKTLEPVSVEELKSEDHISDENNLTRYNTTPFSQADKQNHDRLDQQKFFKKVLNKLKTEEYVYVFGPGEAKHGLINLIEKEGKHFPCKIMAIEAADKLSHNQLIQKVKHFFNSLKYEDAKRRLNENVKENA